MRELIIVLRELLSKSKDGTATFLDWLRALDAVIHLVMDSQMGFGQSMDEDEEEELRHITGELTGEPTNGMEMGIAGSILLNLLLKYLLSQVSKKANGEAMDDESA